MIKKILSLFVLVFLFGGCSCNKDDLKEEIIKLEEEIKNLKEDNLKYDDVGEIFKFYNNITLSSIKSFVVVEASKTIGESKYCDGVVVASNGYYYYVLTDYHSISEVLGYGDIKYRVMDSNANVYDADIASIHDEESGLLLLRVNTMGKSNVSMRTINLGEVSSLMGHVSNVGQINKVKVVDNIKTNTINHSDVSYTVYSLLDNTINGAILNSNNQLCGFYLSSYNAFIDANLIKYIVYSTYSLVL